MCDMNNHGHCESNACERQNCNAEGLNAQMSNGVNAVEANRAQSKPRSSVDFGSWITKREGLLMFVMIIAIFSICAAMCSSAFFRANDELMSEINALQVKIEALNSKIEMYQSMNADKPINITVNIDDKNYIYNPSTGELEEMGPESTLPEDFDKTPFLGIGFYEDEDGYQTPLGIKVDTVYEGSPAALAGIKVGDIIMSVNGKSIATFDDLAAILGQCKANDEVTMQIATIGENGVEVVNIKAVLTYRGYFETAD